MYPDSIQIVGWVVELGPLFIVALYPIWSIYRFYQGGARGKEMVHKLFNPTESWYNTPRGNDSGGKLDVEEDSSSNSGSSPPSYASSSK